MEKLEPAIKKLAGKYTGKLALFLGHLEKRPEGAITVDNAVYFYNLGVLLDDNGFIDLAIALWEKVLPFCLTKNDALGMCQCYSNIGAAHNTLSKHKQAIEYLEKGLEIAVTLSDTMAESICYTNLGFAYEYTFDFNRSLEYYKKALVVEEDWAPVDRLSNLMSLGEMYNNMGNFKMALKYNTQALDIVIQVKDPEVESVCYTNLGNTYGPMGNVEKAIACHKIALSSAEKFKDLNGIAVSHGNLGIMYFYLGQYEKSLEYHRKALAMTIETKDKMVEIMLCKYGTCI